MGDSFTMAVGSVEELQTREFEFSDFPDDVHECILSFLSPTEIGVFSCICKRFALFCSDDSKVWFAMCERRWGSKTHIRRWGNGQIKFKFLYKILEKWENLMGFWRRIGQGNGGGPLIFFEWGRVCVTGSRVLPCRSGSYEVLKIPFLWMGLSPDGQFLSFVDPDRISALTARRIEDFDDLTPGLDLFGSFELGFSNSDLFNKGNENFDLLEDHMVAVDVIFMGEHHLMIESTQNYGFHSGKNQSPEGRAFSQSSGYLDVRGTVFGSEEGVDHESNSPDSLPDHLKSEIYQYFANRTSPGGDRAARKQRRKDKERATNKGRQKWEAEHFLKIANCSPTTSRPLQGLWKGISEDMSLDFYLIAYDDIKGIVCRKVGSSLQPLSSCSPVFWTSDTTFIDSPFTCGEEDIYSSRVHIQPNRFHGFMPFTEYETVTHILVTNSSYDIVIPNSTGFANPQLVEGRVWLYKNGSFGFGFLRNNFIIDLKHISLNDRLLDTVERHYR